MAKFPQFSNESASSLVASDTSTPFLCSSAKHAGQPTALSQLQNKETMILA